MIYWFKRWFIRFIIWIYGGIRKIYDEIASFISTNKDNLYHIKDTSKINDLYALMDDLNTI